APCPQWPGRSRRRRSPPPTPACPPPARRRSGPAGRRSPGRHRRSARRPPPAPSPGRRPPSRPRGSGGPPPPSQAWSRPIPPHGLLERLSLPLQRQWLVAVDVREQIQRIGRAHRRHLLDGALDLGLAPLLGQRVGLVVPQTAARQPGAHPHERIL